MKPVYTLVFQCLFIYINLCVANLSCMHPVVSQLLLLLLVCTKNGRLPMVKISFPFSANAAVANQVLKAIRCLLQIPSFCSPSVYMWIFKCTLRAQGARDSHFLSRREKNWTGAPAGGQIYWRDDTTTAAGGEGRLEKSSQFVAFVITERRWRKWIRLTVSEHMQSIHPAVEMLHSIELSPTKDFIWNAILWRLTGLNQKY